MKSYTLIHAALLAEGQPIIRYFGLKQCETRPFKLFRAAQLLLIVSGVGKESTRKALEWVTHRFPLSSAINIGIAGCSDTGIEIGTLFAARGGPEAVPRLPLKTVDNPLHTAAEAGRELQEPFLADMEASYFVKSLSKVLDTKNIHILKVVSDHLSDTIPKRAFVNRLIGETLPRWAHLADPYLVKLNKAFDRPPAHALSPEDCTAIRTAALNFRFSFQEIKILMEMALDFRSWDEKPIVYRLRRKFRSREDAFSGIRREWENAKNTVKTYNGFTGRSSREGAGVKEIVDIDRPSPGFGRCPVASSKTRCCNLLTLDAVEGCGFDCSYCSIRHFYDSETVGFHRDFLTKLKSIELDPEKIYHIGTGQSSDSLMWGNRSGILNGLLDYAADHPNVILEFKTKSDRISHLLSRDVPPNVITTWSLNPQIIIDNEEHHTASLKRRIESARKLADRGNLVGFHFHPIVHYDRWETDYGDIIEGLLGGFQPSDVAMVSFGTLTFIKPMIKKMREHPMKSRILQMPLEEAGGKLSYPLAVKREMFRLVYRRFAPWHDKVFFYLCMEDASLWPDVFGYDYHDNGEFEAAMIHSYQSKVNGKRRM